VVTIRKPHVHLRGVDADPAKTVIVYNNTANNSGGTFNSATVFVEADDVTIDHLSIVNDAGSGKGQAVALHVTGDRAIFRNLRITGAQDTLFAASRYCYGDYGPCVAARQYFADCYIEGNTDFIFGDSMAVFDRCELHGIDAGSVMYTAQSRHTAEQTDSGYIFDHCHLTGSPRSSGAISLGRSWRPYATVVFLNARIDAPVIPAGWTEWARFGKPTLPTAFYAEYDSTGPGADAKNREPYAHQLTEAEASKWSPRRFLAGKDGWNPAASLVQ
jgi:pectin methylesterase-like acyl-CoA thioesterase